MTEIHKAVGCDHETQSWHGVVTRCGRAAKHVEGLGWRCSAHTTVNAPRPEPAPERMRYDLAEALKRAPRFAPIKSRRR